MNSIGVSSMLAVLVLISGLANTEGGDKEKLVEDCKFRGNMCEVNESCIERLRENKLVENCDTLPKAPEKSLYIEESLSFQPHRFTIDNYLAENWTYSVFISDDTKGTNLRLVDGCCNMKGNDTCPMPATFDKNKTFLVVFPYKDSERRKYCWSIVEYGDAPLDVCADDGSEIYHPCISFQDGTSKIKTRYQPLGRTITKPYDRCYFNVTKQLVQASYNSSKPKQLFKLKNAAVLTDGVNESKNIPPTIRIGEENYTCEVHKSITDEDQLELLSHMHSRGSENFVCWTFIPPNGTPKEYVKFVLCKKMAALEFPLTIVLIAVSVSAVSGLLIFIGSHKACRIYRKLNENIKTPVIRGVGREDLSKDSTDTQLISETETPDEVSVKIGTDYDDASPITKSEFVGELDIPCPMEYLPDQESKDEEQMELLAENPIAKESVSGQSAESTSDRGSNVDIDQCSVKSDQRFDPELNPGYAVEIDGYMPKPQTIIPTKPHKYDDPELLTGKMLQDHIKMDDVHFDCGYTPKYIAKNLA